MAGTAAEQTLQCDPPEQTFQKGGHRAASLS